MTHLPVVAFDESGNTGGNLLDPNQPVFALASVHLSKEAAEALVVPGHQELKFVDLKRNRSGRQKIIELLDSPVLGEDTVLVSGIHKPFMVITKLVDLLVEPLLHAKGLDLYERGGNLAMANLLYFTFPTFIGRERFEALRTAFVDMVRRPSTVTIDRFYGILAGAYDQLEHNDFKGMLVMLLATRPIAQAYCENWDGSDLDPAIPAFVEHASIWTGRLATAFSIVHDVSKALAQEQLILEAMMSAKTEPREIGYDRRKMVFPILASGIDFPDSAEVPAIQIADIIASSAAYCLRVAFQDDQDPFVDLLLKTRVLSGYFRPLWPELKVTPQELGTEEVGGIDANDFIGDYVAGKLGEIPPKVQRRKL